MQLGERQLGEVRRTGRSASNGPGETMFRSVYGVARGLRLSMFGAVAVVTVLAVATEGCEEISDYAEHVFYVPRTDPLLQVVLGIVPLQLFAYHLARARALNVDQPRNLAKTVTVE